MKANQEEPKKTKGWWSFILGLLGFFFGGAFTGIPAIILGHKQMKEYPCWQANVGRILGIITTVLSIGFAMFLLAILPENQGPPTPPLVGPLNVTIEGYNVSVDNIYVDKIYFDEISVNLKNEGDSLVHVTNLTLSSNTEEINANSYFLPTLQPGEQQEASFYYDELSREIGAKEIAATIKVFGCPKYEETQEEMLAEKSINISIPMVEIGETVPEVENTHNLSVTLLSWKESDIAVDGPYAPNTYYTFTAKPSMKFIILVYKFQNNWIREQETPYINAGEIATDKGYIYSVWDPPGGTWAKEYNPRKSTQEEVKNLIGDSGGYEHLLPEESTPGCVVFEIPKDSAPIEASIAYVKSLVKF